MPTRSKPKRDLLQAAFEAIAEKGWRDFSLAELATDTGIGFAEVYVELPAKPAVFAVLGKRLDREMLAVTPDDLAGLSVRERLFELCMRRFDAMQPFKPGLKAMARGGRCAGVCDVDVVCISFCNLDRMADRMLDLAGARLSGLRAMLARRCLMTAWLHVFGIWLNDDSEDQAATLAALDTDLARLERLARMCARPFRRARPDADGEPSGEAPVPSPA